jgi:hypothetical protein
MWRIGKPPIGDKGDEDERALWERKNAIEFHLPVMKAKREISERQRKLQEAHEQCRSQRPAPEPTMEDGVRQWASPALLRQLKRTAEET